MIMIMAVGSSSWLALKRLFHRRKLFHLAMAFIALGVLTMVAIAKHPWSDSLPHGKAVAQERKPIPTVQFLIYAEGIQPRGTKISEGLVKITYKDLSGEETGLLVAPERDGEPDLNNLVGRLVRQKYSQKVDQIINLKRGRYWVVSGSHPQNQALLVVE